MSNSKKINIIDDRLDEGEMLTKLKNIFLNITKSPQYSNYINFLLKNAAQLYVNDGSKYNDEDYFSNDELASILVEFRILPPMPEIIKNEYYENFSRHYDDINKNHTHLLNEYTKKKSRASMLPMIGGKRGSVKRGSVKRGSVKRGSVKRGSVKRRSVKRKSAKRKSVKRRSVKRKSAKRKSVKRRSVKRKSAKRGSVKRRSVKRRSVKRGKK
jgi:hypothetical protein